MRPALLIQEVACRHNYDQVLEIFQRVNSGGMTLTKSDLMFCSLKLKVQDMEDASVMPSARSTKPAATPSPETSSSKQVSYCTAKEPSIWTTCTMQPWPVLPSWHADPAAGGEIGQRQHEQDRQPK
jgi:hypothetical protein